MKIIFATGNEGKMREVRMIMENTGIEVISMKEAGIKTDIVEDGTTFEANALIKARAVAKASGLPAMADDSGLEVDAMNKEPGVYSARFLGEDTSYVIKNQYIMDQVKDVPDEKRTCRYACSIACVFPEGSSAVDPSEHEYTTFATLEGKVAYEAAGENGFGYDPIFFLPEYGKTDAQLPLTEKNKIGHRGKALRAMVEKLKEAGEI